MTKKEYYKLSEDKKLPLRCPCLSNCSRYRFTAYFIGKTYLKPASSNVEDNMKDMGIINHGESISKMLSAGESITFIGGNSSFFVNNGCPEFFLHSHEHKPGGMQDIATHQFSYDEYYSDSKFKPGESRHYTECPEYSLFASKKKVTNIRKKISAKVKAELQREINSKCPFCSNDDVGHFEVHHIDENPSNNLYENLLMLCPTCHSKIGKMDITKEAVVSKKKAFFTVVGFKQ